MLKDITHKLIFVLSLLFANSVFCTENQQIKQYIQHNFAGRIQISAVQIKQLSALLAKQKRSFDLDMYASSDEVHIEIPRALTRLYCLQLLRSGTTNAYHEFIAVQLHTAPNQILSFNNFKKLSKYIKRLNLTDYKLLETAAITHEDIADKKLFGILFPPQTNFRHMLYSEGGISMFKNLRTMIKHQYITQDQLDLWYAYWIINISGFRGHVAQNGSIYLTESVCQAMHKLKSMLDHMLDSPNYNPLVPYLEYRAELLGFSHYEQEDKLLLAHLGSLMRLYNLDEGRELAIGFMQLPITQRKNLRKYFHRSLYNYEQLSMMYLPALFANSLTMLDGDIQKTVALIVPLYNRSIELYAVERANGRVKQAVQLSFNNLSSAKNFPLISKASAVSNLKIMVNGEVVI